MNLSTDAFESNDKLKLFKKKKEAKKYISDLNSPLPLFSRDYTNSVCKCFYVGSFKRFYQSYLKVAGGKRHFYEILQDGLPLKLYLDIDLKVDSNTLNMNASLDKIKEGINRLLKNLYVISNPSYIELDASTDLKLSRHLIYPNVIFENRIEMKIFIDRLIDIIGPNHGIDPAVYDIDRNMRILGSKKGNKPDSPAFYPLHGSHEITKDLLYKSLISCVSPNLLKGKLKSHCISRSPTTDTSVERRKRKRDIRTPFDGKIHLLVDRFVLILIQESIFDSHPISKSNVTGYDIWEDFMLNISIKGLFCPKADRCHKSNSTWISINLLNFTGSFKCSDPDCMIDGKHFTWNTKGYDFKSRLLLKKGSAPLDS